MKKILLDTDIGFGTDADDALALAYLVLHPECDLVGVTTVGRRSDWRAAQADILVGEMHPPGLPVPVAAGADQPLWSNTYWRENPIREWPDDHPLQPREALPAGRAVSLMSEAIRHAPGEVTLITIGQFTNLARLILSDPEAVGLLAGVVAMGGRLDYPADAPKPECNIMLDPVAAGVALQHLGTELTVVPIDAVRGHGLSGEQVERMTAGADRSALRTFCNGWKEHKRKPGVGLADPMTVALAMRPDLVTTENARMTVRLSHEAMPSGEPFPADELTGVTRLSEDLANPHRIVDTIDGEATHAHLMEIFGA